MISPNTGFAHFRNCCRTAIMWWILVQKKIFSNVTTVPSLRSRNLTICMTNHAITLNFVESLTMRVCCTTRARRRKTGRRTTAQTVIRHRTKSRSPKGDRTTSTQNSKVKQQMQTRSSPGKTWFKSQRIEAKSHLQKRKLFGLCLNRCLDKKEKNHF